jgi:hypothetical protein
MPERAIDEDGNPFLRDRDVNSSESSSVLRAISNSLASELGGQGPLRAGCSRSDSAHELVSRGGGACDERHSNELYWSIQPCCAVLFNRSSLKRDSDVTPLFPTYRASSVSKYVSVLAKLRRRGKIIWFRGQNDYRWELVPSLARRRKDWLTAEVTLGKRFRQNALGLVASPPQSDWAWLLLMQHYGVPTRLLDWTENALAALYFATTSMRGTNNRGYFGCVWCLDPIALNKEAKLMVSKDDIPCLDLDDVILKDYRPQDLSSSPTTRPPVAVLAMRQFPRLVNQSGVFTLIHRDRTPIERIQAGAFVGQILIAGSAKETIRRELADMGVTRLSLFPELGSVAEYVRSFVR